MTAKPEPATEAASKTFRIGAVSRITQIPVDTLRAWERRYGVVTPSRSDSSARLFHQADIERLQLIKRLVDAGHTISSVATLSKSELEERLDLHGPLAGGAPAGMADIDTVLVYRDPDAHSVDLGLLETSGIDVLAVHDEWNRFEADVSTRQPDAIIIQFAAVLAERATQLGRLVRHGWQAPAIMVYGFAPSAVVERLERDGIRALRGPVNPEQLLRELSRQADLDRNGVEVPGSRPRRLFDDRALLALASHSASVQCECPHHLVEIVRTLNQFEVYSVECENRNDEDAALHAGLAATTATARELFERALLEVARYEGIELPPEIAQRT